MLTCPEELEKREKQLADKENQPGGNLPQLIAKPKGSAGDGFNLVEAMGLDGDTDLYDAVRVSIGSSNLQGHTCHSQPFSAMSVRTRPASDSIGARISEARM